MIINKPISWILLNHTYTRVNFAYFVRYILYAYITTQRRHVLPRSDCTRFSLSYSYATLFTLIHSLLNTIIITRRVYNNPETSRTSTFRLYAILSAILSHYSYATLFTLIHSLLNTIIITRRVYNNPETSRTSTCRLYAILSAILTQHYSP